MYTSQMQIPLKKKMNAAFPKSLRVEWLVDMVWYMTDLARVVMLGSEYRPQDYTLATRDPVLQPNTNIRLHPRISLDGTNTFKWLKNTDGNQRVQRNEKPSVIYTNEKQKQFNEISA